MNALKVCDAVNWQVELSGMNSENAKIVKTCIARYTCKEGVGEGVKYLFNRVCNAIKSVFGQSDWQQAERAITKHIYSYVPSFCREFVKDKTQAQVHYVAGKSLQFLVWENRQDLEVPKYAKTFVEESLKSVNRTVFKMASSLFKKANLFGLALRGAFSKNHMNKIIQALLKRVILKTNLSKQQKLPLALIQNTTGRILQLPPSPKLSRDSE